MKSSRVLALLIVYLFCVSGNADCDPTGDTYVVAMAAGESLGGFPGNADYSASLEGYTATFDGQEEFLGNSLMGEPGDYFVVNESLLDQGDGSTIVEVLVSALDQDGNPAIWISESHEGKIVVFAPFVGADLIPQQSLIDNIECSDNFIFVAYAL
ncbi:MAG: hypothetical protein AAGA30_21625, partial [Planctomycetota bacterium]